MPQYPTQVLNPPNKSSHDPNSWFAPDGTFQPPNKSSMDPNSIWRTPPIRADVNVNTAPPGSAIEDYYKRLIELMPNQRQQGFADLGSVLGSFATDERNNRVVRGNFQGDFDRSMLEREAAKNRIGLDSQTDYDRNMLAAAGDKRASTSDAMQKLMLGAHLQQGDRVTDTMTGSVSYTPRSEQERTAAGSLIQQMQGQLNAPQYQPTKFEGQWDYQPMNPNEYAKPGIMERIGSYGGAISGGMSAIDRLLGGVQGGANAAQGAAGIMGKIPGLANAGSAVTKFLGPVGAGLGTFDLVKNNRGVLGNMMGGAGTGASIGSMIMPGIGTGIGAGIGALAGGIRSLFGRKKKPQPRY